MCCCSMVGENDDGSFIPIHRHVPFTLLCRCCVSLACLIICVSITIDYVCSCSIIWLYVVFLYSNVIES